MSGNNGNSNAPGDGWEIEDDLDQVPVRKEVPVGRWLGKISAMEKKATKDRSKDYFNICFEVIDVEKAENEEQIGGKVYDIFNINQAALWKLKALISACGFDATGSRVPNLIECEVIFDTFEDEYNGSKSIKTKRYKNPSKETWTGIHETRDATSVPGEEKAPDQQQLPASAGAKTGSALANKKIAKPGTVAGGSGGTVTPPKKGDDEVEI